MLNGKFYTGLPPKMIDRGGGSTRNRLESHIFWPDDTKVESAVETRVRRRASFQTEPRATPMIARQPLQRQSSFDGDRPDVDTKQMFHKEFAKSSIQFCDNIPEVDEGRTRSHPGGARKSLRHQEIAPKPNATKLELPERVIDKTSKTKQAFHSKIQFYDYANNNDEARPYALNNRSNKLPKMDMNNKREMERNSKNSPKLQPKSNTMRNLNATERRNDFVRDQFTPERHDDYEGQRDREREREFAPTTKRTATSPQRVIRNVGRRSYEEEQHSHYDDDHVEDRGRSRYSAPAANQRRDRIVNDDDAMYVAEPRAHRPRYEDDDVAMEERPRSTLPPQRAPILKTRPTERRLRNDFDAYTSGDGVGGGERDNYDDMQYVEQNMRRVRVSNSPKKHVTYKDERADSNYNDDIDRNCDDERMIEDTSYGRRQSNARTGNNQTRQQYDVTATTTTPDYDQIESSPYSSNRRGGYSNSSNNKNNNNSSANYYSNRESRAMTENCYATNNSTGRPIKKSFNNSNSNTTNNNSNNNNGNSNLNNNKQFSNRTAPAGQLRRPPQRAQSAASASHRREEMPLNGNGDRADRGGDRCVAARDEIDVDVDATATATTSKAAGTQKHLRSSLNFSNGEIVADNDRTPTSKNGGGSGTVGVAVRRKVRSTATQRVSVGLPD